MLLTPPLFHPNFGVFPLHQIAHVGVSKRICLKLFGREIIFEEFQPSCVITVPKRYGQTDGRTDDMQSHNRAMRGNNKQNALKIAARVTALDTHSRGTVRCSQRPLYTGTNALRLNAHQLCK